MIIHGGTGNGYSAKVDSNNRLHTRAVTESVEHVVNKDVGRAYSCPFSQSPTAADDCIFYMVNSSADDIVVNGFELSVINATADDSLYVKIGNSGTRNSATALTPVSLNAGSGISADGTFEKGADLDGGSATLTGGSEVYRYVLAGITDISAKTINFGQNIILPKNKAITMWVGGSAAGTYYVSVDFYYSV